ncbi:MAG: hypothetical protein ACYCQI_02930 [Gammaproteobacteria bacterium]
MKNRPWSEIEQSAKVYYKEACESIFRPWRPFGIPIFVLKKEPPGIFDSQTNSDMVLVSPLFIAAIFACSDTLSKLIAYFESQYWPGHTEGHLQRTMDQLTELAEFYPDREQWSRECGYHNTYRPFRISGENYDQAVLQIARSRLHPYIDPKIKYFRGNNVAAIFEAAETIETCLDMYHRITEYLFIEPRWLCGSFPFFCRGRLVYDKDIIDLITIAQVRTAQLANEATMAEISSALSDDLFKEDHNLYGINPIHLQKLKLSLISKTQPAYR